MVTVRLTGGLGNQLFQYAAARAVAERTDAQMQTDVGFLSGDPQRGYELDQFGIDSKHVASRLLRPELSRFHRTDNAISRIFFRCPVIRERHFHFDERLTTAPGNVYLIGYWQSEKYFSAIARELRRELRPASLSDAAKQLERQIREATAVAIHVRRGDYVSNPIIAERHGICSPRYYRDAIEKLTSMIGVARYFIFSDDPAWCAENLRVPGETVIASSRTTHAIEDLYLMSVCNHNVIANSSFSWWGAWIGSSNSRIVIAPNRWFSGAEYETQDLIPSSWIRM
jgi:hypothetical protein